MDLVIIKVQYLEFTAFSGSMFCSGEELLNWLSKSARLGGGFKYGTVFMEDFNKVKFITFQIYPELPRFITFHSCISIIDVLLHIVLRKTILVFFEVDVLMILIGTWAFDNVFL